jgi:hypothetical protein
MQETFSLLDALKRAAMLDASQSALKRLRGRVAALPAGMTLPHALGRNQAMAQQSRLISEHLKKKEKAGK